MKLPNRFRNTLWSTLPISLLLLGGSPANPKSVPLSWGDVTNGLQIAIQLDRADDEPSKAPKFKVELRNAGESDLILNLGIMLANGKKQYPNAIVLLLTDAQGKTRRLNLREPWAVGGRVDPLVVPIPVGAVFSIPVDLNSYWAAASNEFDYKLEPGNYTVETQFIGKGVSQREANVDVKGIALMPYWMGTVTSNRLQFEIASS